MVNQQTLRGNWNEIKGRIRSKWGQLTGDDLQAFDGNVDQLVGTIQRKTGEARGTIEHYLEELTSNGASTLGQAAESVRDYAQQAAGAMQESTKKAAETMRHGYEEAEKMVRERPGESIAVCFGVGMVVGVLLGLTLRGR
ncbi:MAG: CsbD family protein [Pirellulaceae bacterium]|nr:CsbD family protein [Pirellulaceae bacterium]